MTVSDREENAGMPAVVDQGGSDHGMPDHTSLPLPVATARSVVQAPAPAPEATDPRGFTNMLVMGIGFFFVMGGYNPVQSFASSLLNYSCLPLGDISIGLVYLALAVGSLFAPSVIATVGPRVCMVYGSLAYSAFAVSVAYVVLPVVFVSSLAIGFFGAFLNIASGVALAECTTDVTRGRYSGIFQAFNQGSAIPGNLIAIFLIPASVASAPPQACGNTTKTLLIPGWNDFDGQLFLGCGACCLIGTAALAFYTSPPLVAKEDRPIPPSASASLRRIWTACTHRSGVRLLLPLMFYTGVSNAFWSGMFPRQMSPGLVGPAMCILGGGEIIGGLAVGAVIDRCGLRVAVVLIVLVQGGALAIAYFADVEQDRTKFWVAAGLLGVADNGVSTMVYATLAHRAKLAGDANNESTPDGMSSHAIQNNGFPTVPDESAPLLTGKFDSTSDSESSNTTTTTDGFSVFFLLNSIAVAAIFFLLPLFAESSGRSSSTQFLWEEGITFSLMLSAAIGVFADESGRH